MSKFFSSKSSKSLFKKRMSGIVSKDNLELITCCLAELVGTTILVLFTCGNCVLNIASPISGQGMLTTALTFGLTVTCLVTIFGPISGCHINPAVTVGLLANGQINPIKAVAYVLSQSVGGIAGSAILWAILSSKLNLCHNTIILPSTPNVTLVQGIIIEAIITFLLVYVVCKTCNSDFGPLNIGLAVTAGHLFAMPLTSASMNPARSFGPAVIGKKWDDHEIFWVGPLLGGVIAGLFDRFAF